VAEPFSFSIYRNKKEAGKAAKHAAKENAKKAAKATKALNGADDEVTPPSNIV
jgi:hypothetical protein